MNDHPTTAETAGPARVPIGPFDQLVVTHPALDHDSTPATRYGLIELCARLGPSSVLLLELLNATRTGRHEHTVVCDAGGLADRLGLNAARFDATVQRLARFGYLAVAGSDTHNGQQFVDLHVTPTGAR